MIGLRRSSLLVVLAVAALAAAVISAAPSVRVALLPAASRMLVAEGARAPADVIVLSPSTGGAGPLEAADLVRRKIASRVAIFADPPGGADLEFIRRGLPYEDSAASQMRQLGWLGVKDVTQIPMNGSLTEVLSGWCEKQKIHSIVFVALNGESRRMQRVLNRAMKGGATRVNVHPARYSDFDPDRWWESRGGVRTVIIEVQKLVVDYILHPLQR